MLSQKRLKELLSYDAETGLLTWISSRPRVKAGDLAGGICTSGYYRVKLEGKYYRWHRLIWLYVEGVWPNDQIDHIDHDKLNNKLANLREVTTAENAKNRTLHTENTSGVTGVYWCKRKCRWKAQICENYKVKHLGSFKEKADAIIARKKADIYYDFHTNHGATA